MTKQKTDKGTPESEKGDAFRINSDPKDVTVKTTPEQEKGDAFRINGPASESSEENESEEK